MPDLHLVHPSGCLVTWVPYPWNRMSETGHYAINFACFVLLWHVFLNGLSLSARAFTSGHWSATWSSIIQLCWLIAIRISSKTPSFAKSTTVTSIVSVSSHIFCCVIPEFLGPFQSLYLSPVCLPRCVLWPNGARYAYSVYISWIRMWGRDFDWCQFRPRRSTLTPQIGVTTWHWNCGQTVADRAKLCIERYQEVVGWAFDWCESKSLTLP